MELSEKIKQKLSEIKKVVFEEETTDFADVKTATGDILKVTPSVEVGAVVEVVSEDGSLTPAPDGPHELEDGSVITVEGGIISNVEALEAPAEAPSEEEMAAEPVEPASTPEPFDVDELQKQIINKLNSAIIEKIDKLRFAKEESITELKNENAELRASFKQAVELLEMLTETEATPPAKVVKNPFRAQEKPNKLVEQFTKTFKK